MAKKTLKAEVVAMARTQAIKSAPVSKRPAPKAPAASEAKSTADGKRAKLIAALQRLHPMD